MDNNIVCLVFHCSQSLLLTAAALKPTMVSRLIIQSATTNISKAGYASSNAVKSLSDQQRRVPLPSLHISNTSLVDDGVVLGGGPKSRLKRPTSAVSKLLSPVKSSTTLIAGDEVWPIYLTDIWSFAVWSSYG